MNIHITLDYKTIWGEKLFLRTGKDLHEMYCIYAGTWQIDLDRIKEKEYSFEVWKNGVCSRKEWRTHLMPDTEAESLIIRDKWLERPEDSPFYSSLFKEVVFRREESRKKVKKEKGNVIITVLNANVNPGQTLAISGSGDDLGNWTKFIPMDDKDFPLWKIRLDIKDTFEYKFVMLDKERQESLIWEEGPNHFLGEIPHKDTVLVISDVSPVFHVKPWKGAGVAVPVFSLRTENSFGAGEFLDIKKLVDWAAATGQNVIQLLPINDTTMSRTWQDSYPYNANSTFALHPQFLNLPAAGVSEDKAYKALREELNRLPSVDYERVNNEKERLLRQFFKKKGHRILASDDYQAFYSKNSGWLRPYTAFCCLRDEYGTADFSKWDKYAKYSKKKIDVYLAEHREESDFYCFVQYCLDSQLKEVVEYAHSRNVGLKGDLPIGISRTSADAWTYPELFHMNSQAGAPPDAFSAFGQNWGFPTYNWEKMAEDGFAWWKDRMKKMGEYFDCFRIDHILGFFRIWEIPTDAVHGLLGYFNPALPYTVSELEGMGFDMSLHACPAISDWVLNDIFGPYAEKVKEKYIKGGKLIPAVSNQRKVEALFYSDDKENISLKEGFMTLLDDVLFIEDPYKKGYYHPRIAAHSTYSYKILNDGQKDAFNRLYNDFFYHRHNDFWRDSAIKKLPSLLESTEMLTCGEDLGMIPDCVPSVMQELNVLSLEIQRMPKAVSEEFSRPELYPYSCVCATGTHDTSTLRAWWEEDRNVTERYYRLLLSGEGETPYFCEPWICEKILEAHLYSPSMLMIVPLQDWLAIDGDIRYQGNPSDERINIPAIPRHYWRYRMHLTLEKLLEETGFNTRLKDMIGRSGRGRA